MTTTEKLKKSIVGYDKMNVDIRLDYPVDCDIKSLDWMIGTVNKNKIDDWEPEMLLGVELINKKGYIALRCAPSRNWNLRWNYEMEREERLEDDECHLQAEWSV